MSTPDRVPHLATRLTDDVSMLVAEKFGEESDECFHRIDVSVRYGDDRAASYSVALELIRLDGTKSTREIVFRVRKPTANSARVAFRRKLQEVAQ